MKGSNPIKIFLLVENSEGEIVKIIPKAAKTLSLANSVFSSEIREFTASYALSGREAEIVVAIIRNVTATTDLAAQLRISQHTVNNHLKSIFKKTNSKSKTEILSFFLRFAADRQRQLKPVLWLRPCVLVIGNPVLADGRSVATGLRAGGMKVHIAETVDEAARIIRSFRIDMVICGMPGGEDADLVVLKGLHHLFPYWPSFILLSKGGSDAVRRGLGLGACDVVACPPGVDDLITAIFTYQSDVGCVQIEGITATGRGLPIDTAKVEHFSFVKEGGEAVTIGFGGVLIALSPKDERFGRMQVGRVVDLSLAVIGCDVVFHSRGRVVWRDKGGQDGLSSGVGVRFIHEAHASESLYEQLLIESAPGDWTAFIPSGIEPGVAAQGEEVEMLTVTDATLENVATLV